MIESFLFAMPGGSEWLLIIAVLLFVFYWIKILMELGSAKFDDSGTKVIWFIVVLSFPILGVFIYHLFGRNQKQVTS